MPRMNGKRLALSSRCTPELKAKLLAASDNGGRSLMQEIEFRLEQSFASNDAARTIRETIRQEMRAEFEARRHNLVHGARDVMITADGVVPAPKPWPSGRWAEGNS